jgi:diacylglycerol O-acyltransferase / wax synthase
MAAVDNTLDYMDQASFLGLRALGHGPVIQFTWVYRHRVDLDALHRFHRDLGRGLLGRRVERSALPFGRHRWVADCGPDIEIARTRRPAAGIPDWADEQIVRRIDPEHGPSWRLAVQPLTEGGAGVTLVASHTVVDGVGMSVAVADAVEGRDRRLGYPAAGSRTRWQAIREDARQVVRSVPEVAGSVIGAAHLARGKRDDIGPRTTAPAEAGPGPVLRIPSVTVHVDTDEWDHRGAALGGTSNSLVIGFATRLAHHLGWVREAGSVAVSMPVNERGPGDTRGNALTAVSLTTDPEVVLGDLSGVRAAMKAALSGLGETRDELLAPLPLTPLVPRALARRLEGMVLRVKEVGCSNIGDLDPAINRPDGTDAESFAIRMGENLTAAQRRQAGGVFFPVVSGRVHGRLFVSIGFADATGSNTRAELAAVAQRALEDFGLRGDVE